MYCSNYQYYSSCCQCSKTTFYGNCTPYTCHSTGSLKVRPTDCLTVTTPCPSPSCNIVNNNCSVRKSFSTASLCFNPLLALQTSGYATYTSSSTIPVLPGKFTKYPAERNSANMNEGKKKKLKSASPTTSTSKSSTKTDKKRNKEKPPKKTGKDKKRKGSSSLKLKLVNTKEVDPKKVTPSTKSETSASEEAPEFNPISIHIQPKAPSYVTELKNEVATYKKMSNSAVDNLKTEIKDYRNKHPNVDFEAHMNTWQLDKKSEGSVDLPPAPTDQDAREKCCRGKPILCPCDNNSSSDQEVDNKLIEQRIEEANGLIERVMGALQDIKKGIIQYKTCGENLDGRLTDCLQQLFYSEQPVRDTCCSNKCNNNRKQESNKFKSKTTSELDRIKDWYSKSDNNCACARSLIRNDSCKGCNIQEINDCNGLDLTSLAILQAKLNAISDSSDCITTCSSKKFTTDLPCEFDNNGLEAMYGCRSMCKMYSLQEALKKIERQPSVQPNNTPICSTKSSETTPPTSATTTVSEGKTQWENYTFVCQESDAVQKETCPSNQYINATPVKEPTILNTCVKDCTYTPPAGNQSTCVCFSSKQTEGFDNIPQPYCRESIASHPLVSPRQSYVRPKETYVSPYNTFGQQTSHINDKPKTVADIPRTKTFCETAVQISVKVEDNAEQSCACLAVQTSFDDGVVCETISPKKPITHEVTPSCICPNSITKLHCLSKTEKRSNLCVQNLPSITIKGRLTIQNVLNMSIRSSGSMDILIQEKSNIKYEEIKDSKGRIDEQPVRECDASKPFECLKQQLQQQCNKIRERKYAAEKSCQQGDTCIVQNVCQRPVTRGCFSRSCPNNPRTSANSIEPIEEQHGLGSIKITSEALKRKDVRIEDEEPSEKSGLSDQSSINSTISIQEHRIRERHRIYESFQVFEENLLTGEKVLSMKRERSRPLSIDLNTMNLGVYKTFIDQNLFIDEEEEGDVFSKNKSVQCDSLSYVSDITGETVSVDELIERGTPDGETKPLPIAPPPLKVEYQIIPGPYQPLVSIIANSSSSELTNGESDKMVQASLSSSDLLDNDYKFDTDSMKQLRRRKSSIYYDNLAHPYVASRSDNNNEFIDEEELGDNEKMIAGLVSSPRNKSFMYSVNVEVDKPIDLTDKAGFRSICKESYSEPVDSKNKAGCGGIFTREQSGDLRDNRVGCDRSFQDSHPKYAPLDVETQTQKKHALRTLGKNFSKSIGVKKSTSKRPVDYTFSEGEVECSSGISNGEVRNCRKSFSENTKGMILGNLRREFGTRNVKICDEKHLYKNWVTYYVQRPSTIIEPNASCSCSDSVNCSSTSHSV